MQRHTFLSGRRKALQAVAAAPLPRREPPPRRIYARDPDAVESVRDLLKELRKRHQVMTRVNTLLRHQSRSELEEMALSEPDIARLCKEAGAGAAYSETEISKNLLQIRRVERRLKELEDRACRPDVTIEGEQYTYIEDVADNRVMFCFRAKPAAEVRQVLAEHGFRLSVARNAYVRPMNEPALAAANRVRAQLGACV